MCSLHWDDIPYENLARAKLLRRNSTMAERKIWSRLRAHRTGTKFRRQQPIGPYIVDFYSAECGLVIEIDGHSHGSDRAQASDDARTGYLESLGFRVLRYTNRDVMNNLPAVIEDIVKVCIQRTAR